MTASIMRYIDMAQETLEQYESGAITLGEFLNLAHLSIGHLTGLIGESDVDPVRTQMNSIEALCAWTVVEDKAIGEFKEELDQNVAAFRSELKLLNDRFPRSMAP